MAYTINCSTSRDYAKIVALMIVRSIKALKAAAENSSWYVGCPVQWTGPMKGGSNMQTLIKHTYLHIYIYTDSYAYMNVHVYVQIRTYVYVQAPKKL